MKTILHKIAETKRSEIQALKNRFRLSDFESMDYFNVPTRSLSKALAASQFSVIAEFKRKSPSAGTINLNLDPLQQASFYESSGASAISCLTDFPYFGGSPEDLRMIRSRSKLPVLRKDFILDEIQIFQARAYGADAILLISELLEPEHLKHLTIIAQSLEMEVLTEAHDREHLERISDFTDVIGINNRNLHLQKTDLRTSFKMADFLPKNKLCISESGITSFHDLIALEARGYRGALIGESLMKENCDKQLIYKSPLKKAV